MDMTAAALQHSTEAIPPKTPRVQRPMPQPHLAWWTLPWTISITVAPLALWQGVSIFQHLCLPHCKRVCHICRTRRAAVHGNTPKLAWIVHAIATLIVIPTSECKHTPWGLLRVPRGPHTARSGTRNRREPTLQSSLNLPWLVSFVNPRRDSRA